MPAGWWRRRHRAASAWPRVIRQQVEAEDVDGDLQDREDARLDHRHRVQQRADRGGRHHGRRQPAVEGHQRRLADAEDVTAASRIPSRAGDAVPAGCRPRCKVQRAGEVPGPDHGQQQKADRGAEQDAQVDAPAALACLRAAVGDQRDRWTASAPRRTRTG